MLINEIKSYIVSHKKTCNLFNTEFNKRVLISYTIMPFLSKKIYHSNAQESRVIASIFNELEFNVDIIHYTNKSKIDYDKYDVIFGFGVPFECSFFTEKEKDIKRIHYSTGAHVCYQNYAEIKRIEEVNKKCNSNISPKRLVSWSWSMSIGLSDALIVIGNEWTKSTYSKYTTKPIYTINATALINKSNKINLRETEKTKRSFLWFGSGGLVHKGLDLCLEYFSIKPELNLHICGPMEDDFNKVFKKYFEKDNIHYHGFTDVNSQKYIDIVTRCNFSILPTCSEGQATALLTTMGAGLIPIATKFSGIDVEKFGLLIKELDLISIDNAIKNSLILNDKEILEKSIENHKYILAHHTIISFKKNLKLLISRV
jgi:hypothetical protein